MRGPQRGARKAGEACQTGTQSVPEPCFLSSSFLAGLIPRSPSPVRMDPELKSMSNSISLQGLSPVVIHAAITAAITEVAETTGDYKMLAALLLAAMEVEGPHSNLCDFFRSIAAKLP